MNKKAKFAIGQVVKHRLYDFRGVIYDVDSEFSHSEEWYQSISTDKKPIKNQPFYHLYAENDDSVYEAYVSEQNLLLDENGIGLRHPMVALSFKKVENGHYQPIHLVCH